jgi:hypothetical protein
MGKVLTFPKAEGIVPIYFPGFPGLYAEGTKIPIEETGMSEEELNELITDGNYPIEIIDDSINSVKKVQSKVDEMKGGDD